MPHQCLKCGNLFSEGTTTILRGCPECRGTRFFFTREALGADERRKMLASSEITLRQAIEDLVQKARDGTTPAEIDGWVLAGPPPTKIVADPKLVPEDLPRGSGQMLPGNNLLIKLPRPIRRAKPKSRASIEFDYGPPPNPSPPRAAPPRPEPPPTHPALPLQPISPPPAPPAPAAAPAVAPAPAPTPPQPTVSRPSGGPALAPALPAVEPVSAVSGEDAPETIRIHAPGRYEIDVKRLLEDSPVVVQKDGTYLIHLPSLFDSNTKGRKGPG